MIRCAIVQGRAEVDVSCSRRPAVYLDQFALHHFATDAQHRDRFLAAFNRAGELMFSSANFAEVVLTDGASFEQVTAFLDAIGTFWVPIEIDVWKVAEDMYRGASGPHPALDGDLMRMIYDCSSGAPNQIALGSAIRGFREKGGNDGQFYRDAMQAAKERAVARVSDYRDRYRSHPGEAPIVVTTFGRMVHVATAVMRNILVDEARSFAWTANDAVDLAHALMPLAVADAVFLDKAWKRRVARLAPFLPSDLPRVYYQPEAEAFLNWLEDVASRDNEVNA
jgi:hypothetical protein